jgi:hypothetical protein
LTLSLGFFVFDQSQKARDKIGGLGLHEKSSAEAEPGERI